MEKAHRAARSLERPQLTMIMEDGASDHRCIGAVAVRVTHRETATVIAHGCRVERINDDSLELTEENDEGWARVVQRRPPRVYWPLRGRAIQG